jgi:hypothetical protein
MEVFNLFANPRYVYNLSESDKFLIINQLHEDFGIYYNPARDHIPKIRLQKYERPNFRFEISWFTLWNCQPTLSNIRHMCVSTFNITPEDFSESKTYKLCCELHRKYYRPTMIYFDEEYEW